VWFARCRVAPIPPPIVRGRRVTVEELDAAIVAALARGHSSLREPSMARVALSQVPPHAKSGRVSCVVCGIALPPAVPGIPVCQHCADDPSMSRELLAARRASIVRDRDAATSEAQAARDALTAEDTRRWDKIATARLACERVGRHAGKATPEQRAWIARVQSAIHNPQSTAVSNALRRVWYADEVAYWSSGGATEALRRVDAAAAHLEACLEEVTK
jgi:hypothetical protein